MVNTLGKTTVGSASNYIPFANEKLVCQFVLQEDGDFLRLIAYIKGDGVERNVRGIVYSDLNNLPDRLLAVTDPFVIPPSWNWYILDLPSPARVSAGKVWFGFITDGQMAHVYDVTTDVRTIVNPDSYATGPSDPFGPPADQLTREVSIYAEYEPVAVPLSVDVQPETATINIGETITVQATAAGGTPPYTYAWQIGGTPLPNTTSSIDVTGETEGIYTVTCTVSDAAANAASDSATITVQALPPLLIDVRPDSATINIGETVTLTAVVSGGVSPYTYSWVIDGTPIADGDSITVTGETEGVFTVTCTVTDSAPASSASDSSEITVVQPPPATLFDSCDSLTPPNGPWTLEAQPIGTLSIDSTIKVEGAGSIRCDTDGTGWDAYIIKRADGGLWDLRNMPELHLWVRSTGYTKRVSVAFESEYVAWHSYRVASVECRADEWTEIVCNLRRDISGNPISDLDLQYGYGFNIEVPSEDINGVRDRVFTAHVDSLTLVTVTGERGTLNVSAKADGTPVPAAIEVVAVGTYLTPFTIDLDVGSYVLNASYGTQTDSQTVQILAGQTTVATFQFTLEPVVMRPLHTEGRWVKDDLGNIVILRGINTTWFNDDPFGWFVTWNTWEPDQIRRVLQIQRQVWGMNVVRIFVVTEWWLQDTVTFQGKTSSYRNNIKQFMQIAREEGMYVVVTCHDYYYQTEEHNPIQAFGSVQGLVDYWLSVATELGVYENFILECWNEPTEPLAEWVSAMQQGMDTMRAAGINNIFVAQHGYNGFSYNSLLWVEDYPLTGGNVLYSTHIFRYWGSFNGDPNIDPSYNSIKPVMDPCRYVGENLNLPLWIGETGPLYWQTNPPELTCYENTLTILNEWQIGYAGWWWREEGDAPHTTDRTTFNPTAAGQILIDGIAAPPRQHPLTVESSPIPGVPYLLDEIEYFTPHTETLLEGPHTVKMPSNVQVDTEIWNFKEYEDGSTNPERTINLTAAMTITATYEYKPTPPEKGWLQVHAFEDGREIIRPGVVVELGLTFETPTVPPLEVDPGIYTIQVTYPPYPPFEETVTVEEGQTIRVDAKFKITPILPIDLVSVIVGSSPIWVPLIAIVTQELKNAGVIV